MWLKQVFLGFIGLASGAAISAGVFSFIISIGVVPRIIGKSRTAFDIMAYENAVLLGGTAGNLMALFSIQVPLGITAVIAFGLSAGIFTGCLSVALAEILNTFPIMFRRLGIKEGLSWILFFMALACSIVSCFMVFCFSVFCSIVSCSILFSSVLHPYAFLIPILAILPASSVPLHLLHMVGIKIQRPCRLAQSHEEQDPA